MLGDLHNRLQPYLSYFGDNPWIQALVIVVVSCLIAWIFDRFIIIKLKNLARITKIDFDNQLVELLHDPIYTSVILLGLGLAVYKIGFVDPFRFIIYSGLQSIAYIVWTVLLLRVTKLIIGRVAHNDRHFNILHPQTLPLFENIANIAIFVFAIYIIFSTWHVDMTAWLASAGIVGIAVGFAAKDTLANLFSGVFILADAPYKIGDFIVLDSGERGEITHIGIRSTRLLTRDDVEVTVPNSVMGNTKIINEHFFILLSLGL